VFLVVSDLPEDVKEALRQQKQQKQQQQQQALLPWVEQSAFVPGRSGYVGAIALYEFVGQTEEQLVLGRQALRWVLLDMLGCGFVWMRMLSCQHTHAETNSFGLWCRTQIECRRQCMLGMLGASA
jgi:hypothetical protein